MTSPLVSVCIPTYNNPAGLRKILSCITAQTYRNLEIVISVNPSVNEKANEEIREIIEGFHAIDTRIRSYYQAENIGVDKNFRFVLDNSTGEYFMFAQDDDMWSQNFISAIISIIKDKPGVPVGITPAWYVLPDGSQSEMHRMDRLSPFSVIGNGEMGMACMGVWRKSDFLKYTIRFPTQDLSKGIHTIYGEDLITIGHILMACDGVAVARGAWYEKGLKPNAFGACFQDSYFYSFRSWYYFMKVLVESKQIPARRKMLIPFVGVANFFRACAVTAIQVAVSLPEGNPLRVFVQKRFFGTN